MTPSDTMETEARTHQAASSGASAEGTRDTAASGPADAVRGGTAGLVVRPATLADAPHILGLVNQLAQKQIMLPRSPASVIEGIRDFVVADLDGEFAGCGALHVVWADLAEIRSLAVEPDVQRGGVGRAMAEALVEDARRLGVPRLFAFTYVPGFFEKMEFRLVPHEDLPHKVFKDCLNCPKFQACDEIAMERILDPAAARGLPGSLPVLSPRPVRTRPKVID